MEQETSYQKDIESIRKLMERSVKFISLSGLSGILSGVYALIGAGAVHLVLVRTYGNYESAEGDPVRLKLVIIAVTVLLASLGTGYWLSLRKSRKIGAKIWDATGKRLLINLALPLVTGGIFIMILIFQGYVVLIAPACLIFYGLALINASPNVYEEVRNLGYSEIILGLIATAVPGYGLIFWAIGFGVLHILYGALMYSKYDA
jgi:hypothetical protein